MEGIKTTLTRPVDRLWSLIMAQRMVLGGCSSGNVEQENSAKLTNQRVSCAFTSSLFSFHVRHILPTSKFQNSLFYLFSYRHQ